MNHRFRLFKTIAIPTKINETYAKIQTDNPYILSSYEMDGYALLSEHEYKQCIANTDNSIICRFIQRIRSEKECEWNLLNSVPDISDCKIVKVTEKFEMFKLIAVNKWIFVAPEKTSITSVCFEKISQHYLNGVGIIELNANCLLKFKTGRIYPQRSVTNASVEMIIPHLNISTLFEDENQVHLEKMTKIIHSNFSHIENMIKELKQNQKKLPQNINQHDMHHYITIYIIVGLIIAVTIYRAINRKKGQPIPAPRTNQQSRISMPNLTNLLPRENVTE